MATKAHTARAHAWATTFTKYTKLNQKLDVAQPDDRDALERAVVAHQNELLDLPAPSFCAVIQKLEILWEADLHGFDQTSEEKRLIIEDLQDLLTETAELDGQRP